MYLCPYETIWGLVWVKIFRGKERENGFFYDLVGCDCEKQVIKHERLLRSTGSILIRSYFL